MLVPARAALGAAMLHGIVCATRGQDDDNNGNDDGWGSPTSYQAPSYQLAACPGTLPFLAHICFPLGPAALREAKRTVLCNGGGGFMFRSGDLVPGGETSECGTNAEQVLDQACFGAAAGPNRQGGTCRVGKASGRSARDAEEPARGEAPQRIIVHDARPRSQIMPGVMGPRDCSCYVTLRPKLVLCANRPHSRKSARRAATRELGREPHRVSDARSSERARPLQMLWGWANGGKHPMSAAVSVQSGHVHVHVSAAIQPGIPALLRARAREMRWDEMKWEEVAVGVLSCTSAA
ncbi:hypothetical protein PCL_08873 [Purpureocillium lilacinum]|uniref:Uncharacterized protein n=1 Tax=Purpureocillium lilacinum TaxID=33203 RepID=A0A2U3EGE7_PURLI|nr:hypothetical protein Purlil1_8194 [Purpureocillium lilacinum]PWI73597.1 hypothetical protein PCL_08873 [Purpureocillium lilacinum]